MQQKKPSTAYDPEVLRHATERRKLVCAECMSQGLSPKDVNMYKCDECGDRGHRKFVPEQLRQHKNSQGRKKMVCTDCTARHKQIEKVLRLPKAWKCKCPGKGHERHHITGNVACDLVPVQMGERRWPGKNMKDHPGLQIENPRQQKQSLSLQSTILINFPGILKRTAFPNRSSVDFLSFTVQ